MHLGHTSCSRGLRTARNALHLDTWEVLRQLERQEWPWTLVGWLVLHPADLLSIGVVAQCIADPVVRDWVQHLHADDSHVIALIFLLLLSEVVVDLAGAQQHLLHVLAHAVVTRIVDDGLELGGFREVLNGGNGGLVAQHGLRGEDHQWALQAAQCVAAQQVEVVGRRGGLSHGPGTLCGHLQETLDACGGVVWALALVTVWQQQHQRGLLSPLGFTGGHVLVDDGLCTVDEVTELGFPDHQGVWVTHGVAVLEAHRSELGQCGVVGAEGTTVAGFLSQLLQWVVAIQILVIEQHCVTLGEGTAEGILTDQADQLAALGQRAEGDELTEAPVDVALLGHFLALLDHWGHAWVDLQVVRRVVELVADLGQQFLGDGGVQAVRQVLRRGDAGLLLRLATLFCLADIVEHLLELLVEVALYLLGIFLGEVSATDEGLGVLRAGGGQLGDDLVHQRLGHGRIVGFVVTAATVGHQVDEDILAVLVAVVHGQLSNPDHGFGVITVDVEDRGVEALGQVGCVVGGTARIRGGGEANLVVDDDVDGAAHLVGIQLGQVQGFLNDAQAGEGGVAMQHDWQHGALFALVQQVLTGAGDALHHGIHGFQVGRVGGEVDLDIAFTKHLVVVAAGAQVVLHIAGTASGGWVDVALELGEDLGVRLAHDVGQHVETATVRHADDNLVQVCTCGAVDGGIHHWDQGLCTLQGEALLSHVLGLQEVLESLS